jgi:hypothetical protein
MPTASSAWPAAANSTTRSRPSHFTPHRASAGCMSTPSVPEILLTAADLPTQFPASPQPGVLGDGTDASGSLSRSAPCAVGWASWASSFATWLPHSPATPRDLWSEGTRCSSQQRQIQGSRAECRQADPRKAAARPDVPNRGKSSLIRETDGQLRVHADRWREPRASFVLQARDDLDGLHPPALPELLERLARQRLLETAGR